MILTPEYIFKTIECIHPDFLAAHGIKALVLDVDNTLTADNSQVLEPTVQAWLDEMRAAGIRLTIVSNNTAKRVRPFAERIGLDWVPLACKPFTIGLYGCPCLYLMPRTNHDKNKFVLLKRKFEPYWIDKYYQKGGKLYE